MHKSTKGAILAGACAIGLAATVGLGGCAKAMEPYQDAPTGQRNTVPADLINMPDGYSNVATKCDHGNRIYVAFKGDDNRAAIAVVPADPTCTK